MNYVNARRALQDAWAAVPLDYKQVARATSTLLELCDYNVVEYESGVCNRCGIRMTGGHMCEDCGRDV